VSEVTRYLPACLSNKTDSCPLSQYHSSTE